MSNRLCAAALTMPLVTLSGNLYILYLDLAAVATMIYSRVEFANIRPSLRWCD